jgi:calcineurin-like phosphoesterase family protein
MCAPNAFFSDPHFGHANIIKYSGRPFKDMKEMGEVLDENYNAVVSPTDVVLWLGDVFFGPMVVVAPLVARMNGRKLLVKGNHDKSDRVMVSLGFELVMRECTTFIAGRVCRINHYPYAGTPETNPRFLDRRPKRKQGEVLLHGHTHSDKRIYENQIHVGVDAWDYRPVLYEEVEALIQRYLPVRQM